MLCVKFGIKLPIDVIHFIIENCEPYEAEKNNK